MAIDIQGQWRQVTREGTVLRRKCETSAGSQNLAEKPSGHARSENSAWGLSGHRLPQPFTCKNHSIFRGQGDTVTGGCPASTGHHCTSELQERSLCHWPHRVMTQWKFLPVLWGTLVLV